jgi:sulfite exporter TauE/SafE
MSFGALLFMVSRGTVEAVAFGSLAFGAGTFPVLLLVGGAGARATAWIRRFPWAAGVGCIAAGLLVALRPHFGHIAYWCGF